jgi:hypothetical protein
VDLGGIFGNFGARQNLSKTKNQNPPKLREIVFSMVSELWRVLEGFGAIHQNSQSK